MLYQIVASSGDFGFYRILTKPNCIHVHLRPVNIGDGAK